jgi:8-oxo-dGTP pyrophosphatase MutT (NUDIX family)
MVINSKKLETIVLENKHPKKPSYEGLRFASVALMIPRDSKDKILGILKADNKRYAWGNQVALPGGHIDKSDKTPMHAAIREVNEELGLKNVELKGSIGHFMTIKNVCVEAFAGYYDETEEIIPLESEIAKVLEIPIDHLMETHIEKGFSGREPKLEELLYPYEDVIIWGLTARIIHHFLEISTDLLVEA